jgi:hypothetical protein
LNLRDEISRITHTVNENHGLDGGCLELEINVAALAHLEGGKLDDGVILPEGDHVLKEDISVTLERSERVSSFLPIERGSGVAEMESSYGKILFLDDLTAVPEPVVVAGVAVAPLVGVEADSQQAALTFARSLN